MQIRTVTARLGNMRKPQEFVVYPPKITDPTQPVEVIVQSGKAIGRFDPATRQGVLNAKGGSDKYFMHLTKFMGAVDFEFPAEFVQQVMAVIPGPGDQVGPGVFLA